MLPKLFPLLFLGVGIFVLVQVAMPFVAYKLWEYTTYRQENTALISPNPKNSDVLGVSVENQENFPAFISNNHRTTPLPYSDFYLTIPSLKLERLKVLVESNSFDTSLAQLPGTALPGEVGNVFVTGHSTIPQAFDIKNYKTVFTRLPDIKRGEQIIVEAGGQRFEYEVKGLKVVSPKEVWVINPPDQTGRYLSLMTCVPPGLYLKRLIVLTELK